MKIMTVTFKYDINVMISYDVSKWVSMLFPGRVVNYEEIRDNRGYLTEIKVDVNVGGLVLGY